MHTESGTTKSVRAEPVDAYPTVDQQWNMRQQAQHEPILLNRFQYALRSQLIDFWHQIGHPFRRALTQKHRVVETSRQFLSFGSR